METTIYHETDDLYDDIPCMRLSGAGDIPGEPFQTEHIAGGYWTAWYRLTDWIAVMPELPERV
jgi:hypothetical protein